MCEILLLEYYCIYVTFNALSIKKEFRIFASIFLFDQQFNKMNKGIFVKMSLLSISEGMLEVLKGDQVIGQMEVGRAFGEMALLYNCNRTASVKGIFSSLRFRLSNLEKTLIF